jgi:3-oxoacyl-[acyl-carrier protein] reductase
MGANVKAALVTGGSRGIGRAIVEEFAAAGYAVAFTYLQNKDAAETICQRLCSLGRTVAAYQADARDFSRAAEVISLAQEDLGPVTTLVNNAGIKRDGPFHKMDFAGWSDVIGTNLTGAFNYSRALAGSLIRTGGSIINITSVTGITGAAGQANYAASKAGMIGLTKALAKELAPFAVRVNAIAPGYIDTEMTASMDEEVRKRLFSRVPLRRPGAAQEVARLAVYLAGDDAAYVTGQVWNMDGGLT